MKKILAFIIIIIVAIFMARSWWNGQLSPVSSDKSTQIFVVSKGENLSKVIDQLKKDNLIKSAFAFSMLSKQTGLSSKIQAGTFRLSPSDSARDVLNTLTTQPLDNWVTLIEGWRVEEMAEKLNGDLKIDKQHLFKVA